MEWVLGAVGMGLPLLQAQTTHREELRQAKAHHDQVRVSCLTVGAGCGWT